MYACQAHQDSSQLSLYTAQQGEHMLLQFLYLTKIPLLSKLQTITLVSYMLFANLSGKGI